MREFGSKYPRFNVQPTLDGIETTGDGGLMTDDWNEVLEYLEAARIARVMQAGGYEILTDDSDKRATAFHIMRGDKRLAIKYSRLEATDFIEAHAKKGGA